MDSRDVTFVLRKAEAKGGSYHRRVPRKKGNGYTYYYDPDKYERSQNAHLDGNSVAKSQIHKSVSAKIKEAGKCKVEDMKSLVTRYGAKSVGGVLKEMCGSEGGLSFKKGVFTSRGNLG